MQTSDIPVPPFAAELAATEFHGLLVHYARSLDGAERLTESTLFRALDRHRPDGLSCAGCGDVYPCSTVLSTVMTCRMPVPWTPLAVARTLHQAGEQHWRTARVDSDRLEWGADQRAVRGPGGNWTLSRAGRPVAGGFDDDELCTWLLADVRRFTLPAGVQPPSNWPAELPETAIPEAETTGAEPDLGSWLPGFSAAD